MILQASAEGENRMELQAVRRLGQAAPIDNLMAERSRKTSISFAIVGLTTTYDLAEAPAG